METNEKELDEKQLENVHAGIYKKEIAEDLALQNESNYRQEMINRLKEEREELVGKSKGCK